MPGLVASWRTPFLPTDIELSWRWVEASGSRHPQLQPELTREKAAAERTPPCRPNALFHAGSMWTLVKAAGAADEEGWRYGLAWNSSTWDSRPGLLTGCI